MAADKQLMKSYGDLLVANKQLGDRLEDLRLINPEELGHYVRSRLGRKEEAKKLAKLGVSQRQIAKLLGVSHTQIQKDLATELPKSGNKVATDASKAAQTRTAHEEIAKFAFDQPAQPIIGDAFVASSPRSCISMMSRPMLRVASNRTSTAWRNSAGSFSRSESS